VDVGPVVERDGDIFGRTVNHASRLASIATAGQVVVSEAVASALETHGIQPIEPLGEVTLKGIAVPVRAYRIGS
jgi:class 3 adenylate cyclase